MTDIFLNDDNDRMKLKFLIRFYYFLDLKFKKLKRDLTNNEDSSYSEENIKSMVTSYLKNYKEDVLGKSVADYFLKPYFDYFCSDNYSDKGCNSYYEFFNNIQSEGELKSDNLIKNIKEALQEKIDNIKTQSEFYNISVSLKSAVKKLLDSVKQENGDDIERNKQELEKLIDGLVEDRRNKISTEKTMSDRLSDSLSKSQDTELEADIFRLTQEIKLKESKITKLKKDLTVPDIEDNISPAPETKSKIIDNENDRDKKYEELKKLQLDKMSDEKKLEKLNELQSK